LDPDCAFDTTRRRTTMKFMVHWTIHADKRHQVLAQFAQMPFDAYMKHQGEKITVFGRWYDGGVEEAFAAALGAFAVTGVLFDVRDQARIKNALPIVRGIKTAIEVKISPSEVQPDLFGHLL
jgi:hypothetical protein